MKNIYLSLLAVVCALTSAVAQQYKQDYVISEQRLKPSPRLDMIYAVMVGVDFPSLSAEQNFLKIDPSVGFQIGFRWGVDLGFLEVVPEFWYTHHRADVECKDASFTQSEFGELSSSNIEVPIIFALEVMDNLRVNLGPSFALMSNNSVTLNEINPSLGSSFEFGQYKSTVGYVAGLSYTYLEHYVFDIRYSGRFTSAKSAWYDGRENEFRHSTFGVNFGYKF